MAFRFAEVRHAARGLLRTPTIALSAVLCLALGIGSTTAIASAVQRALLDPLPFVDPDRLVAVHRVTPHSGPDGTWPHSAPNYLDFAERTRTIGGLAAMTPGVSLVTLRAESVNASLMYVTANLFSMLGARPAFGRLLQTGDDGPDQARMAVVSHEFWRTRLGEDPNVVGTTFLVDGQPTTIVGVAQRDLRVPHGSQVHRADLWMPLVFTPANRTARRSNFLFMLGRLANGTSAATANAEMKQQFETLVTENPQLAGEGVRVAPLHAENVGNIRTPLLLIFGAVGLVLLIACTNVASLLLARGIQRRRDMSIRVALGASTWDTMRYSLMDSVIVTTIGTLCGLALAIAGVRTIGVLAAARLPQLSGLSMNAQIIGFAIVLATVVALICGVVPAWRSSRVAPQEALGSNRGSGAGRNQHRALRLLVSAEIATSLILLIGAGLLLRSFAQLMQSNPGFETEHVLTLRATASSQHYRDRPAVRALLEPALEQIRAIPGVREAGAINLIPYAAWGNNSNIRYEGASVDNQTSLPLVEQRRVTPSFFATTGQQLIAGRLLTDSDDENAPIVVVVSQSLMRRDFGGESPVGKRFHLSDTVFATIVGVVSDIRNNGPFNPPQPEMYYTYRQGAPNATSYGILVRTTVDSPVSITPQVRAALQRVDATVAVSGVTAMPDVIAASLGSPRFYLLLVGSFAAVAIVLAAAGLYGILSYSVAQRTREFGIRLALGSRPSLLLRMVTMQGIGLVLLGLVVGLAGAAAATRLMTTMLYGLDPLDIVSWISATVLLFLTGTAAALIPAFRATRVDPIRAIQSE